jgi:hypothetical protein
MRGSLLLLALLGVSLAVTFGREADGAELDQEEAYRASSQLLREDITDLIETAETSAAAPKAKQIKIIGNTAIDATLRMFAEGGNVLSVTDATNGYGVAVGTSTSQKDHMRLTTTSGEGFAINSKADKVGLFVDATSGYVGVGHTKPVAELDVKGTTHSSGSISTTAKGGDPSLQISGVEDFKGIQLNKDGKGLYLIGRGSALTEREMSFHIPSATDYGGGKEPKFHWVSGSDHETLAHLEASTGNMYVKGKVGIGAIEPKTALDIRGSLNVENADGEAIITFPRGADSGFHIRSTDNPAMYTTADDRMFIKGDNGFVGIQTTAPKTMLDVRGAMNLEDASGAAVIYFPSKNAASSFFIRCADDPSNYSKDQERFFIGADGKVGIGTNSPSHGLTVSSEAASGNPLNDVAIAKGNLHVHGAIYDTFGGGAKYYIDLKKDAYVKSLNVESMVGVGTAKPTGLAGSDAAVHIQGEAPVMRIENTKADGDARLSLQTGGNSWDIDGSTGFLKIKNNGKTRLTISDDGKLGIGELATNPQYGLHLETDAPVGDDRNDLSIQKGNLYLKGQIIQIGDPKYTFSMENGGLLKDLNVEGNFGVGLGGDKPKFALHLGQKQVMSLGDQLFMAGSAGASYVSANAIRENDSWTLHKPQDGASAMVLENTGVMKLLGTTKAGSPLLETMFTVDAKSQTATFPMSGFKAGFGTDSPAYPMQVNGATDIGNTKASLAFGMAESSMGYLGANDKYVYMATSSGAEAIALDQTSGFVGVGTGAPKSSLHIAGDTPGLSLGSSAEPNTHAFIKAVPSGTGLNMVVGLENPLASGGKLTFDFSNEMKFGGSGPTVFSRGDTIFKSGNVGIGGTGFDGKFKLHVKGDMKVDGRCWVAATRPGDPATATAAPTAAPTAATTTATPATTSMLEELDLTDLLQEGEDIRENVHSDHGIDLGETLHSLTRVLRKQHKQMGEHDQRISDLDAQLTSLMSR